jgi:aryl-alcohol dehydrogenase-like predicted oxidoreductase
MASHFDIALAIYEDPRSPRNCWRIARKATKGYGVWINMSKFPQKKAIRKVAGGCGVHHGIKAVTVVARAFLLIKAPNGFPIISGGRIGHWRDNIRVLSPRPTPEQRVHLKAWGSTKLGFRMICVAFHPADTGV